MYSPDPDVLKGRIHGKKKSSTGNQNFLRIGKLQCFDKKRTKKDEVYPTFWQIYQKRALAVRYEYFKNWIPVVLPGEWLACRRGS